MVDKWSQDVHFKEGTLKGYDVHASDRSRHEALERSVHKNGYSATVKKLVAVSNLSVKHRMIHATYRDDIEWLENKYGAEAEEADRERRRTGHTGTRHHPKSIHR